MMWRLWSVGTGVLAGTGFFLAARAGVSSLAQFALAGAVLGLVGSIMRWLRLQLGTSAPDNASGADLLLTLAGSLAAIVVAAVVTR